MSCKTVWLRLEVVEHYNVCSGDFNTKSDRKETIRKLRAKLADLASMSLKELNTKVKETEEWD